MNKMECYFYVTFLDRKLPISYNMYFQIPRKWKTMDLICDRIHRIKAKKGQKKTMEPCQELTWDFRFLTKLLTSFTQKKAPLSFVWNHMFLLDWTRKFQPWFCVFLLLSISSTYLHCLSNDKYKILPYLHAVALLCKWSGNFSQKLLESGNSA